MDNETAPRRCLYCGKIIEKGKDRAIEIFTGGKSNGVFCSAEHWSKHCKRVTRIIKRMSREEFLAFIKEAGNGKA